MKYAYYETRFMFIHHSHDGGQIELCKGDIEIANREGFYESIQLFDLPAVGDIMKPPECNSFWIVSCVIRCPRPALDMAPPKAIILLCEQALYSGSDSPNLYVGFEKHLVGIVGPDRVLKPLQSTEWSGFSWGYSGTGPRHVSKSILFHYLGKIPSDDLTSAFEKAFIVPLKQDEPFVIEAAKVGDWIDSLARG